MPGSYFFMKKIFLVYLILGTLFISGCIPVKEQKCGIESCHGLDITCGPDVPEVCTEEYRLGDFCRQYADCEVLDGNCQLVESDRFGQCKSCVDECSKLGGEQAFVCEDDCRQDLSKPERTLVSSQTE